MLKLLPFEFAIGHSANFQILWENTEY